MAAIKMMVLRYQNPLPAKHRREKVLTIGKLSHRGNWRIFKIGVSMPFNYKKTKRPYEFLL